MINQMSLMNSQSACPNQLILDNRKVTIEVTKRFQSSHGCACEIIRHRLHFHKFVQGGIQDSLQYTIDITVQTYRTAF